MRQNNAARSRKTHSQLKRLLLVFLTFTLSVGGIQMLGGINNAWAETGTFGGTAISPTPFPQADDNTLYVGRNQVGVFNVQTVNGVPAPSTATRWLNGANSGHFNTIAMDSGKFRPDGNSILYGWYSLGTDNRQITCANGNSGKLGVVVVKAGQSVATGECIPQSSSVAGGNHAWAGGEVIQRSGQIFLSGQYSTAFASADGGFAIYTPQAAAGNPSPMFNYDPTTGQMVRVSNYTEAAGTIRTSGALQPLGDAYPTSWPSSSSGQSSDMALDSWGRAYTLARLSNSRTINGITYSTGWYLTRVYPGAHNSGWKFELLSKISSTFSNSADVWGLAFLNGYLYAGLSNGHIWQVNPLDGAVKDLGDSGNAVYDLASTQTAYVISGSVVNDVSADGSIDAEQGFPGARVLLYQQNTNGTYRMISEQISNAQGNYAFLLNGAGDYAVRVAQPQIAGVNAWQTYASAGTGETVLGKTSSAKAKCLAQGDLDTGGVCTGALPFGSPDSLANGLGTNADSDNFAFWTQVHVESADDIPEVSFGFTADSSWGDGGKAATQSGNDVKSTLENSGPYHVNLPMSAGQGELNSVQLGEELGNNTGVNDPNSDAHPSDDGVSLKLHDGSQRPLQGQILSVGQEYEIVSAVKTSPDILLSDVNVRAWTTPVNTSAVFSPTFSPAADSGTNPYKGTPDAVSHEYVGNFMVPRGAMPYGGLAPSVFRVSASTSAAIADNDSDNSNGKYAAMPGSATANTYPWVSDGEIEDYQVYYAGAQVRVAMKVNGGAVTSLPYTVSNTSTATPSTGSGTITTVIPQKTYISAGKHAIKAISAPTSITLNPLPTGLDLEAVKCYVSTNKVDLSSSVTVDLTARKVTLAADSLQADLGHNDVTCEFDLVKGTSLAKSELSITPTTGEEIVGDPIIATATIRNDDDALLAGRGAYFTVPSTVTVKNAAGYTLTPNADGYYTCTTGSQGANLGKCAIWLFSDTAATYPDGLRLAVREISASTPAEVGIGSPQSIKWNPGAVDVTTSSVAITATDDTEATILGPIQAGKSFTVVTTVKDSKGNPISSVPVQFYRDDSATPEPGTFRTDTSGQVSYTWMETLADDPITTPNEGLHTLSVRIQSEPSATWTDVTDSPLTREWTADKQVDAIHTYLQINDDAQAGTVAPGSTHDISLTARDQYGNRVTGVPITFNCAAASPSSVTCAALSFAAASGTTLNGVFSTKVTSAVSGDFTVKAKYGNVGDAVASVQTINVANSATPPVLSPSDNVVAKFLPSSCSATDSYFTVAPSGTRKADGSEYFTLDFYAHDGVNVCTVAQASDISIQTVNTHNCPLDKGLGTITWNKVTDGHFQAEVTSTCAATFSQQVSFNGTEVSNTAGHANPQNLTYTYDPSTLTKVLEVISTGNRVADGSDRHSVKVMMKDANSNPAVGETVALEATPAGLSFYTSATGNSGGAQDGTIKAQGEYFAYVGTSSANEYTLSGTGLTVVGITNGKANFVAGSAAASTTTIAYDQITSLISSEPAGADGILATITVRDSNQNLVRHTNISTIAATIAGSATAKLFTADNPGDAHSQISAIPTQTDANGQIKFRVLNTMIDDDVVVNVKLGADNIAGANPQKLTFTATTPCMNPATDGCSTPSKIWADTYGTTPLTVTANGTGEHVIQVHAFTKSGQDLANQDVSWQYDTAKLSIKPGTTPDVKTGADGIARIHLVTTVAGTYVVNATLAGMNLTATDNAVAPQSVPVSITYGAGAVDYSKSSFDVLPRAVGDLPKVSNLTGTHVGADNDFWIVRVTAKDRDGNYVDDLAAVAGSIAFDYLEKSEYSGKGVTFSAIAKVAANVDPDGSGAAVAVNYPTFIAYARTTTATEWSLGATAGGNQIGARQPRSWKGDVVDPIHSSFTLTDESGIVADGNSPQNAAIVVRDSFDNPLGGVKVRLSNETAGDDVPTRLVYGPNTTGEGSSSAGTGQADFTLRSSAARTYQVKAWVDMSLDSTPNWVMLPEESSSPSNPAPVTFIAGSCDAATSVLEVDKDSATVGENIAITLRLRDAKGNACTAAGVPTLQVSTGALATLSALAGGSGGVYTATITDRKAESVELSAQLGGVTISRTKIATALETSGTAIALTFTTDAPEMGLCTPAGAATAQLATRLEIDNTDETTPVGTGTHQITANVVDKYCNPVKNATVDFDFSTPLQHAADSGYVTGEDGKAWVKVKSNTPSAGVKDNFPVSANITKLNGATVAPIAIKNDNDASGTGGSLVDGKVFAKFGTDTVDLDQSSWTITPAGPLTANGTALYTVNVTLADTHGNRVDNKQGSLNLNVSPALGIVPALAGITFAKSGTVAANDLVYTATFAATKAGIKNISLTSGGQIVKSNLGNNSESREFAAGNPVKAKSYLEVTNLPKVANGVDKQTATLTILDADDNPVAGVPCDFEVTPNVSAPFTFTTSKPSPAQSDANGQCVATFQTTKADTYHVSASYSFAGTQSFGPLDTTFIPGIASSIKSKLQLNGANAASSVVNVPITATALVVDEQGNPIPNTTVYFQVGNGLGVGSNTATIGGLTQTSVTTNVLGMAELGVSSTKADAYQVYAALGGQHGASGVDIANSPAVATFTAGAVSLTNSVLGVDSLTYVAADGTGEHTIFATLRDQYHNPVAGQEVSFAPDSHLTLAAGSANPGRTGADGRASIVVTSTWDAAWGSNRGSWPVSATWNGQQIDPEVRANYEQGGASAAASTLSVARHPNAHNPVSVDDVPGYVAQVLVKNAAGQIVPGAKVVFTLDNGALFGNGLSTIEAEADSAGVASVTLYSHKLATGTQTTLTAKIGGAWVGGTQAAGSYHPSFGVGVPFVGQYANNGDPASRVTITSGQVEANGSATHTATVYAVDYYGNLVPNAQVKLTQVNADSSRYTGTANVTISDGGQGVSDTTGKKAFTLTATKAGTFYLKAEVVKDQSIPTPAASDYNVSYNSPVAATFAVGAANAQHSTFTLTAKNVTATAPLLVGTIGDSKYVAVVDVLDATDNPVSGAAVIFTVTGVSGADTSGIFMGGSAKTAASVTAGSDGKARLEISSTRPGNFQVRAEIAGAAVTGSPQAAAWQVGSVPDMTTSTINYSSNTALSVSEDPDGILVSVGYRDSFGNPLPNIAPPVISMEAVVAPFTHSARLVSADVPGASHTNYGAALPSGLTSDANGKIEFRVVSAAVETISFAARVNSVNILGGDGSPKNLSFYSQTPCYSLTDGCANVSKIWADTEGVATPLLTASGMLADVHKVYVKAFNRGGQPLANQGVEWNYDTAKLAVPAGGRNTTKTDANGIAEIWLASNTAGDYAVSAKLVNKALTAENAVAPQSVPVVISYGAGAIDYSKSSFEVLARAAAPQVSDAVGAPATGDNDWWIVRVQAKDSNGNPISIPVSDPAFNLAFANIATQNSGVYFSQIQLVPAGTTLPGETTASSTPAYIAYARSVKAGTWSLTAFAGTQQIGSPTPREWLPGDVDTAASLFNLPNTGTALANGSDTRTATVSVRDRFGNPIPGKQVQIAETPADAASTLLIGPSDTGATSADAKRMGTFVFTLQSTTAKTYQLTAFVRDAADTTWVAVPAAGATPSNPAPATFTAGQCAAATSLLTVDKVSTTVGTNIAVTVSLRDANNNPCSPDSMPLLQLESGAKATATALTTVGGGNYTATVTDKKAESFDLSAQVGSATIANAKVGSAAEYAASKVRLTFTADDPSIDFCTDVDSHTRAATRIWIDNNSDAPTGVGSHRVSAEVTDKFCNAVAGAKVEFGYASPLELKDTSNSLGVTDTAGQIWVSLKSDTASVNTNDYPVTARVQAPGASDWQTIKNNGGNNDGTVVAKFGTSGVDPTKSTWTISPAGPLSADGLAAYVVTVQLKDVNNTFISGQPALITLDVTPTAGIGKGNFSATANPGEYTAVVTSTSAGIKRFAVSAGSTINAANQSAYLEREFTPGEPSDSHSRFTVTKDSRIADGTDIQTATLTLLDVNDNPVPSVACDFATAPAVAAPFTFKLNKPAVLTTDASGRCVATMSTTKAGSYTVTGQYRAGSPLVVKSFDDTTSFKAGAPDASKSKLLLAPVSQSAAGAISATANVVDSYGNPVAGVTVYFRASVGKNEATHTATLSQPTQLTDAMGNAVVSLTSTAADAYDVFAALGGQSDTGGTQIADSPAVATFTAGAVNLAMSTVEIDSATYVAADLNGSGHMITATLRDAYANPVAGQQVTFTLDPALTLQTVGLASGTCAALTCTTDANGNAKIVVVSDVVDPVTQKGSYPVSVKWNAAGIGKAVNANFETGGAAAAASTLTMERCTAGNACGQDSHNPVTVDDVPGYVARVFVANNLGGKVVGARVVFTLDNGARFGNGSNTIEQISDDNGYATVSLYSHKLATGSQTTLTAKIGGSDVGNGSPQHPTFAEGKPFNGQLAENGDPASRVVISSGVKVADGADAHTLRVYAVDKYGNKVPGAAVRVSKDNSSDPVVISDGGVGVSDATGAMSFAVTSATAGSYVLRAEVVKDQANATLGYQVAYGSPVSVSFKAGAADASNSVLSYTPVGPLKVGTAPVNTYTVNATLQDANRNPVSGSVKFTLTGSGSAALRAGTVTSPQANAAGEIMVTAVNGVASFTVYSKNAGVFEVRAVATTVTGDTNLTPTSLIWTPGEPSIYPPAECGSSGSPDPAAKITAPGIKVNADGNASHQVQITVRDEYCNPVPGVDVTWSPDAHLSAKGAVSKVTDSAGLATASYASNDPSDTGWNVNASVAGTALGAANLAPAKLRYAAVDFDLASSKVSKDKTGPLVAGDTADSSYIVTAQLRGADQMPWSNESVTFACESVSGAAAGVTCADLHISAPTLATGSDGKAVVTVYSQKVGSFVLSAKAAGKALSGSPLTLSWKPGAVNANASQIDIVDAMLEVSQTSDVIVTLRDQYQNVIVDAPDSVAVTVVKVAGNGLLPGSDYDLEDNGATHRQTDGTFKTTITGLTKGTAALSFRIGSGTRSTAQDTIVFDITHGVDLTKSAFVVTPKGTRVANGSDAFTATATIRNDLNVPLGNVPVSFDVPAGVVAGGVSGPGTAVVSTDVNGEATVSYTTTRKGSYKVSAAVAVAMGNGIVGVKDIVFVAGAASLATSTIDVLPDTGADIGTPMTVVVTLKDAQGNVLDDVSDYSVELRGMNGGAGYLANNDANFTVDPDTVTAAGGTFHGTVTGHEKGKGLVGFRINGRAASASDDAVFRFDDVADLRLSALAAPSGDAIADGKDTRWVRATVVNAVGQPIKGLSVDFVVDPNDPVASPAHGITDSSGQAMVYYTSTKAGTFTVSAKIGAASIAQTVQIKFRADSDNPAATTSTISVNPVIVKSNGRTATATVTLRDRNGNLITKPGDGVVVEVILASASPVKDITVGHTLEQPGGTFDALLTTGKQEGNAIIGFKINGKISTNTANLNVIYGSIPNPPIILVANKKVIAGNVLDANVDKVILTLPTGSDPATITCLVKHPSNTWSCDTPLGATDGWFTGVAVDTDSRVSNLTSKQLDVTAPASPVVDTANENGISGKAEPGTNVTITLPTGSQGVAVGDCTVSPDGGRIVCPVDADGSWKYPGPFNPGVKEGSIQVIATDPAGNDSDPVNTNLVLMKPNLNPEQVGNSVGSCDLSAGDKITVEFPTGVTGAATADVTGCWSVKLPADVAKGDVVYASAVNQYGNSSERKAVVISRDEAAAEKTPSDSLTLVPIEIRVRTPQNKAITIAVLDKVLASNPNVSLTFYSDPSHGTVEFVKNSPKPSLGNLPQGSQGRFRYTPEQDYLGNDSFTVTVRNAAGGEVNVPVYVSVFVDDESGKTVAQTKCVDGSCKITCNGSSCSVTAVKTGGELVAADAIWIGAALGLLGLILSLLTLLGRHRRRKEAN